MITSHYIKTVKELQRYTFAKVSSIALPVMITKMKKKKNNAVKYESQGRNQAKKIKSVPQNPPHTPW